MYYGMLLLLLIFAFTVLLANKLN